MINLFKIIRCKIFKHDIEWGEIPKDEKECLWLLRLGVIDLGTCKKCGKKFKKYWWQV